MSTEKLAFLMGAKEFSKPLEDACIRWGIINGRDKARFLAQCHVESMGFTRVEENMNYSAERLMQVFPGRNGLTMEIARNLAAEGPRAVANFVYGGKWGRENLGNDSKGDGWKYRGRGLIQTTGRDNYRATSIGMFGDLRLLDDPDMLLLPEHAASSAAYFWYSRRLNGVEDVREVTRRINRALLELGKRRSQTARAYDLLDSLTA
jgi:putative chitinase